MGMLVWEQVATCVRRWALDLECMVTDDEYDCCCAAVWCTRRWCGYCGRPAYIMP